MSNINYHRYCDSITLSGYDKDTFLNKWYIWASCEACGVDYSGLKEYANYCFNHGTKMDLKE